MSAGGAEEEVDAGEFKNESMCLVMESDGTGSGVKPVTFNRGVNDVHAQAAKLLGLPEGERLRCFHLPHFEKAMGWSVHMYIDLDAIAHKLDHNTNATQLWLIANLPNEPPEVQPDSIHGPVLLTAEDCRNEEYVQLDDAAWAKLVDHCRGLQPNAQFLPQDPVATPPNEAA